MIDKHSNRPQQEPMLAKVLRYFIYAIAFVPLIIFSQYISPFHFGKVVVFRTFIQIMVPLYVMLAWEDRSYRPRTNAIFWAFLIFAGAFSLATVFSINPYASFYGSLERMGGLFTFWHYFVFFVIATSVLRTRQQWFTFLELSIFASILAALYGICQKIPAPGGDPICIGGNGRERIFGTIGNAALFSGYEIVAFFLALTLFFKGGNSPSRRWLFGSAIVLDGLAIVMAVVRGSLLGLGVGLFLFTALYYMRYRAVSAKKVFVGLAALAALFFLVVLTPIKDAQFVRSSRFLSRVTDTNFEVFTAKTRFWAWEQGIKGWAESPKTILVGWGPENFNIPFSKYFNPKFFTGLGAETFFDRAHNMFVEILVTMGLVGLAAYLWLYFATFRSLNKIAKEPAFDKSSAGKAGNEIYRIGFIPLLVAYAIHNAFIFDTSANFIIFFTALGFMAFLSMPEPKPADRHPVSAPVLRNALAVILVITAAVMVWKTNIIPAKANYASTRAILRGWDKDLKGALEKHIEAVSYNSPGRYEHRHRFTQYLLETLAGSDMTPELTEVIKLAIVEVDKNIAQSPHDYLPLLYQSRLYLMLGKGDPASPYNDKALEYSMKALEYSPTFIRTYYEIAQAYLNKGEHAKAIEYFRAAAELNPEVGVSYWYWGIAELEAGNTQEGLKLIDESIAKGHSPSEDEWQRLVGIYLKLNDYKKVVSVYEHLVKLAPKNAQYHASLAVAYAQVGNREGAIKEAKEAARLDPQFEAEAKRFVQQLGGTW